MRPISLIHSYFLFLSACPEGFHGLFCNMTCPENCFDKCDRNTSKCAACEDGFYGDTCMEECANCYQTTCNQTTGHCDMGCIDGMYGPQCTKPCPEEECKTCDIITGLCLECKPYYYGVFCEKPCSSFCQASTDGRIRCARNSGVCSENACQDGYYLRNCTKSCNDHCGADFKDDRPCDIVTGTCTHECVPKWYGDSCDKQCSESCVDGLCNRTGYCISGCMTGYYGEDCRLVCTESLTCNDGTCHRINGNCSACDEPQQSPRCRTAGINLNTVYMICIERNGIYLFIYLFISSGHMLLIQRRINVDLTSCHATRCCLTVACQLGLFMAYSVL